MICYPLGFKTQVDGLDRIKKLQQQNHPLLLTMNHSSLADTVTLQQFSNQASVIPITMAALSTFNHKILGLPMQVVWPFASRLGLFSVNAGNPTTEKTKAFARKVLTDKKYPLCIFPEGRVNWNNAQIGPCKPGTMQFAVQAANTNRETVNVVPIGITYIYSPKAKAQAAKALTQMERQANRLTSKKQLLALTVSSPKADIQERIDHLTNWVVEREEKAMALTPHSGQSLSDRINAITHEQLNKLRTEYGLKESLDTEKEVTRLHHAIVKKQLETPRPPLLVFLNPFSSRRKAYTKQYKKTQTALRQLNDLQILQSSGDAINLPSNLNNQMEAINRLRCLVTGQRPGAVSTIRNCTAHVTIGEPIAVRPTEKGQSTELHTEHLQSRLQTGLEQAVQTARTKAGHRAPVS